MPTPRSVTREPCSCGFLARAAKDVLISIKFHADVNEYTFEDTGKGASLIIYHCPMCGGVASESKRGALFRQVPAKEWARLRSLTSQLRTIPEIEAALGK